MFRYMNERNHKPTRRDRARYFQSDYDQNRGRFDPDWDLKHEYMPDVKGPGYGRHQHNFDHYEESEGRFRRQNDRDQSSALFSEKNSELNERGFFGKGPKGWTRDDEIIREEVCEALHDSWFVDASEIEVEVKDGNVHLRGAVDNREARREAERSIEDLPGVKDIRNEIRIQS